LVFIWRLLRQEPLIAMGFRFRRSTRLGPLRFNFAKGGLSSISVGGRGASFNIPVARSGGARTTVGVPGTGLSWSVEHASDRPAVIPVGRAEGLPNSRRLRPGQLDAFKQSLLAVLRQELFAPGSAGALLWENASVSRLLAAGSDRDAGSDGGLCAASPGHHDGQKAGQQLWLKLSAEALGAREAIGLARVYGFSVFI
jgi:hypothetical protein